MIPGKLEGFFAKFLEGGDRTTLILGKIEDFFAKFLEGGVGPRVDFSKV